MGAPATYLVQRHRSSLFSSVPLLIIGADERRIPLETLTPNDTMVAVALDLTAFVDNVLQVRPETTDVLVVIGDPPLEGAWASEMRRDFQSLMSRVTITWLNDLPFDKMLEKAAGLSPRAALLYFLVAVDVTGAPYVQGRALEKLRAVATAPIFGLGDYDFGRGIVGGRLLQSQFLGQQAAIAGIRILAGEPPGNIKIAPAPLGIPVYDWRELHRWGIRESQLPANSTVLFREPGAWEQYRWQIVLAAAAIAIQMLLIAGLLYQRRRRRFAEVE